MRCDSHMGFSHSSLLGYDQDENGKLIINEEEAKTVRLIFFTYLYGYSTSQIAELLTALAVQPKRAILSGAAIPCWAFFKMKDIAAKYWHAKPIHRTISTIVPEKSRRTESIPLQRRSWNHYSRTDFCSRTKKNQQCKIWRQRHSWTSCNTKRRTQRICNCQSPLGILFLIWLCGRFRWNFISYTDGWKRDFYSGTDRRSRFSWFWNRTDTILWHRTESSRHFLYG